MKTLGRDGEPVALGFARPRQGLAHRRLLAHVRLLQRPDGVRQRFQGTERARGSVRNPGSQALGPSSSGRTCVSTTASRSRRLTSSFRCCVTRIQRWRRKRRRSLMQSIRSRRPGRCKSRSCSTRRTSMPALLAVTHFVIVAAGTKDFSKGNGTGPFACKEFTPANAVSSRAIRTFGSRGCHNSMKCSSSESSMMRRVSTPCSRATARLARARPRRRAAQARRQLWRAGEPVGPIQRPDPAKTRRLPATPSLCRRSNTCMIASASRRRCCALRDHRQRPPGSRVASVLPCGTVAAHLRL